MTFYGNPNVTITAIDTSGGIVCWRTSGQTPCFIHASAKAITATGTGAPYRDVEFSWDFGDPSSTETFTDPTDDSTANTNSDQVRPSAVHCYRSAGTYTITLTVRGLNGSGYTTAQVTQQITVTTYSASGGNWYFDSAAAGGGDGSIGTPFNTVAQINTKAAIANNAIHLKKGSNWAGTTGITLAAGPLRIDAYGSGANPIVDISSGAARALLLSIASAVTRSDIVVSGVKFRRSGSASDEIFHVLVNHASGIANDVYIDNCDFSSAVSSGIAKEWITWQTAFKSDPSHFSGFGLWGCSLLSESGDTATELGFFGGSTEWGFFYGGLIEGNGASDLLDHHIYSNVRNNCDYAYIQFGQGTGRNYCINANCFSLSGSLETAQYHCVSNCDFTGVLRAFDASESNNDPTQAVFDNFVVQRVTFHGLTGDGIALFYCGAGVTLRDYDVWDCNGGRFWVPVTPTNARNHVYRGRLYLTHGSYVFDWTLAAWSGPQTFTDNVVYGTSAAAKLIGLDSFANHVSIGSIIDRNQYWIPTDTDSKGWFDSATAKTFAQWQVSGFDVNGLVADPHWLDPANGDFTPNRRRVRVTATA